MMRRGQARRSAFVAIVLLLMSVIGAGLAGTVEAQVAPIVETADLRLWPEYDDPGLLVIVSGTFAEGTALPLQAAFPIPAGARNIQATYLDDQGSLINRPFEVKDGKLTYELPTRGFHYEYYVDSAASGNERNLEYDYVAPYAVNALRVAVQQPARSSSFTLSPAAENTETGTDGLTYHVLSRRNLAAGETLGLGIKYSKTDTGLSAPQMPVAPTAPAQAPATSAATSGFAAAGGVGSLLPWLLIAFGLALGAGALLYWWTTQRRQAEASAAAAEVKTRGAGTPARSVPPGSVPPMRTRAPQTPQPTGEPVSFCTNCGHPLKTDDRFCSQCGAPRRS